MVRQVHNITNSVVQDFTANALLALGASPIMSDSVEEAAELMERFQRAEYQHRHPTKNSSRHVSRRTNGPQIRQTGYARSCRCRSDPGCAETNRRPAAVRTRTIVRGNLAEISVLAGLEWGRKRRRLEPRTRASRRDRWCCCPEYRHRRCRAPEGSIMPRMESGLFRSRTAIRL